MLSFCETMKREMQCLNGHRQHKTAYLLCINTFQKQQPATLEKIMHKKLILVLKLTIFGYKWSCKRKEKFAKIKHNDLPSKKLRKKLKYK